MDSKYFVFLCLLFLIVILITISYSSIFSSLTKCSEVKSLASPVVSNSSLNLHSNPGKLPLSQYFIFSSWNSACSGKYVSTEQIQNVLTTGCRFLDFLITNISGQPMICSPVFKNDNSKNSIPLNMAIQTCMNNAFQQHITINYNCSNNKSNSNSQTYTLHNYDDPLFIQLRFQNDPSIDKNFLNKVAEIVGFLTRDRHFINHHSNNLPTTIKLEYLKHKVILLVDINTISGFTLRNSHLHDITNLVVGHYSGVMMYPFQTLLKSVPENIPPNITQYPQPHRKKNHSERHHSKNPSERHHSKNHSQRHHPTDIDFDSFLPIEQYTMAIPNTTTNTQPTMEQMLNLAAYHNVQFTPFLFYKQN
jgi:hypothetical protein